jgi:hypothetical protein
MIPNLIEKKQDDEAIRLEDLDICGIDGAPEDHVTHHEFNRWIRRVVILHVLPIKKTMGSFETILTNHIKSEERILDKISGGITVMKWVFPIATVLVNGAVILIFYILHKAGML